MSDWVRLSAASIQPALDAAVADLKRVHPGGSIDPDTIEAGLVSGQAAVYIRVVLTDGTIAVVTAPLEAPVKPNLKVVK